MAFGVDPDEIGDEARHTLGHGMSFAAASFATSVVVSLVSSIATSRIYGVTVIGEYALVAAPWVLVSQFSSLNEQVAFLRALSLLPPRDRRVSALFGTVLSFSFALTLVVGVVTMTIAVVLLRGPVAQPSLVVPAIVIVASYVVLENTSWNLDMVFAAFRRGRELFWARAAQVVGFLVVAVVMAAYTRSVWGLTVATVASFALALIVRVALVGRVMQRRTTREEYRQALPELRNMVGFGLKLLPGTLAGGLTAYVGTWVLGASSTIRAVGAYARAGGLASRLSDAGYRIGEILFPTLVRAQAEGDVAGYRSALDDSLRLTAVALFGIVAVASGVARSVMSVFGPGFADGANALTLLLLAYAAEVVAGILGQSLLAAERVFAMTSTAVTRLAATAVTVYPFTHAWGATGAAGSFLLGAGMQLVARDVLVSRSPLLRDHRRSAVLAVRIGIVALGGFAASHAVHATDGGLVRTAIAVAAGIAIATLLAIATGCVRPDERRRLHQATARWLRISP